MDKNKVKAEWEECRQDIVQECAHWEYLRVNGGQDPDGKLYQQGWADSLYNGRCGRQGRIP